MDAILRYLGDGLREWCTWRHDHPSEVAEQLRVRAVWARQRAVQYAARGKHRWSARLYRRADRLDRRASKWRDRSEEAALWNRS